MGKRYSRTPVEKAKRKAATEKNKVLRAERHAKNHPNDKK